MTTKIPFLTATMKSFGALLLAGVLFSNGANASVQAQSPAHSQKTKAHGSADIAWKAREHRRIVVKPAAAVVRPAQTAPRRRTVGRIAVHRPFGPAYYGYGFHYSDAAAARWLAFTAITLKALDTLDEEQVRYHEQAQIEAAAAPLGEEIAWEANGASGSVIALRQGTDSEGHSCREFQHVVSIGGTQETAFGTACLEADGSWRIVS